MSVQVMSSVWDLNLPTNEKIVLLAYADHADKNGFSVFPSVSTIAAKAGYSDRSVQAITRRLQAKGILQRDGTGPHGTNRWRIVITGGVIHAGEQSDTPRTAIRAPAEEDAGRTGAQDD